MTFLQKQELLEVKLKEKELVGGVELLADKKSKQRPADLKQQLWDDSPVHASAS